MAEVQTLTFPGCPVSMGGRAWETSHGMVSRTDRERQAGSWSHDVLSLSAAELRGLDSSEAEETIASLLDLCRIMKSREFVILDLARLSGRFGGDVDMHAVDALRELVSRVCGQDGSPLPAFGPERSGSRTDLRVILANSGETDTGQVLPGIVSLVR